MSIRKLSKIYHYIRCIPKTLFFNFYYLPFKQAVLLPILVNHRTQFLSLGGSISVPRAAKTGKIKFGFGKVQIADSKFSRFIWNVGKNGNVQLGEHIKIGTGSKIHVQGNLNIASDCNFTGEATIVCNQQIDFGKACLVSWQTLFMDSDLHSIRDTEDQITNFDQPIKIEEKVWIGSRSTILKGVTINKNSVVASAAVVTKSFSKDSVIGGNPAKKIADFSNLHFQP